MALVPKRNPNRNRQLRPATRLVWEGMALVQAIPSYHETRRQVLARRGFALALVIGINVCDYLAQQAR